MPEGRLCCKIFKNNQNLKTLSTPLDTSDWKTYRNTLKSVQKEVNSFLSELVEQEKEGPTGVEINENEDDDDDDEDDEKTPTKRKSSRMDVVTIKKRLKT